MTKERPGFCFKYITQKRYFTTENTAPIAEKFSFHGDYPLAKELNYAAGWFDTWKNPSSSPAGKKDKAFFEEMARHAEALSECFDLLGFARPDFLAAAKTYGLDVDIDTLKFDLDKVSYAAKFVARQTPNKDAGRPTNIALTDFIKRLHKTYRDGTGKDDRITYSAYTSLYSGNFFEFVETCLSIVGVTDMTNGSLGKAIYKTLSTIE